MSNARQPKWDWTSHWPQMEDLYRKNLSIPRIAKAIRSEGFEPSERAVYLTFTSKGYPTNHLQRAKFLERSPDASTRGLGGDLPANYIDASTQNRDLEEIATVPSNLPGKALTGRYLQHQPNNVSCEVIPVEHRPKKNRLDRINRREKWTTQDQNDRKLIENLQNFGLISPQTSTNRSEPLPAAAQSSYPVPIPDCFKSIRFFTEPPIQRKLSFRDSRSYGSGNRSSQSTVDSGYISGRGSPYTLPPEILSSANPSSLEEFHGLFRVACNKLHESRNQNREVSTCSICHYSSIHNLGWSAKHFTLAEFKIELGSQTSSGRINDLDAVGNTVLFYAAVSGVNVKYLITLINAGVDPYHLNAAGQLFLHWLRPSTGGLDCFVLDLVNLMNLLQPNRVLAQQDNDGQTVLHTLAAYIPLEKHQAQLFEYSADAGWPPTTPDRFGKSADGSINPNCTSGSKGVSANSFNAAIAQKNDVHIAEAPCPELDWVRQFVREINAHNVITIAHNNPQYVDPETGDTVINALSRVNTGRLDFKCKELLNHLQLFVSKGVSLNRHNYDGCHPLASFTLDRVSDNIETGNTKSTYLDALLWQDRKRRVGNQINVNMKTREGATALYNAAIRARPDSVRSLIEAGANVNARLDNERATSILKATLDARNEAVMADNGVLMHMFKEVISQLNHAGAVIDPTSFQERCRQELRK